MTSHSFLEHAVRASFIDALDKRVVVCLQDGRQFIGTFRSFDQFSTIVLEDAVERKVSVAAGKYADDRLGLCVVRGENIVMLGEMKSADGQADDVAGLARVPVKELDALLREERAAKRDKLAQVRASKAS